MNTMFPPVATSRNSVRIAGIDILTKGQVSEYIGHDKNFSPVLYFRPCHRNRAILAVTNYLATPATQNLVSVWEYLSMDEIKRAEEKIYAKYLQEAIQYVYDQTVMHEGYYITYLPKNKNK